MLILDIILLIVGFVVLIYGADWLVDGASGLAKKLDVPDLVIGLTIVAFGTSAPELVVNLVAAFEGSNEIALTNILGSNIMNVLVILGLSALIYPIGSQRSSRVFDIPMAILAGVAVLLLGTNVFGVCGSQQALSRLDGVILLAFFALFMLHIVAEARKNKNSADDSYKPMGVGKAIFLILLGCVSLVLGGELTVRCAVKLATAFGVSQAVIGVTIVALGTSLPELATSAVAAYKHNSDLAIGNIIGSNIFNVFMILGISAVIRPLPIYDNFVVDASLAAIAPALVWLFVGTNKKREVKRWQGAILMLIYVSYLVWLLV